MSIKLLDDEQMKEIVTAAILTHISPEKRDELIKETLKKLLETREKPHPTKSYTTIKYSPLQEAFEEAAKIAAREIMGEQFAEGTPAREKIQTLVVNAASQWLEEKSEALEKAITDALIQSVNTLEFKKSRY